MLLCPRTGHSWVPSLGHFGPLPCIAFEAVIDFTIFYRAIAGLGIAIFRLIYINHTDLAGKDSPLKYLFTCGGVGLALVLTLTHIREYTLRLEGPDFSSALFHVHYCMQVVLQCIIGWLHLAFGGGLYRVSHQDGKNLQLTQFQQCWQLVSRYCSYLLPRQDGRTSQS